MTKSQKKNKTRGGARKKREKRCLFGFWGAVSVSLLFVITGFMFYTVQEYTHFFAQDRPNVLPFVALGLTSLLTALYALATHRQVALAVVMNEEERILDIEENKYMCSHRFFNVHGEHFFITLYVMEVVETTYQIVNYVTFYSCSLRKEFLMMLLVLFGIDGALKVAMIQLHRLGHCVGDMRERLQMIMDIVFDFICMVVPFYTLYTLDNIPILPEQLSRIICVPGLGIIVRAYAAFVDDVRKYALSEFSATLAERMASIQKEPTKKRRRSSYDIVSDKQGKSTPRSCMSFMTFWNALVCCLYSVWILLVAMRTPSGTCSAVWEQNCAIKARFCNSPFQPTCDCVVLDIQGHNYTQFPEEMYAMTALRKVSVKDGPLKTLDPDLFVALKELNVLCVDNNEIEDIPKKYGWQTPPVLRKREQDPRGSRSRVQQLPYTTLDLDNNRISYISPAIGKATLLRTIRVANNSIDTVPKELFTNVRVNIILSGNRIVTLPDIKGNIGLVLLGEPKQYFGFT